MPGLPGGGSSLLGQAPGAGGGSFINLPGTGGLLGGRAGVSTPKGIPTSISSPGTGAGPADLQMPISAPQPEPISPPSTLALRDDGVGPGKRRAARWRNTRSRHRHHARTQPRPASQVLRNPDGAGPISFRRTSARTRSSTRTVSFFSIAVRARHSTGLPLEVPASSTPTSAIRLTFRTNGRPERSWPAVRNEYWRPNTKTLYDNGSMTFTVHSSRRLRRGRRFATRRRASKVWKN